MNMEELARRVKAASITLAAAGRDLKDKALAAIAGALEERKAEIVAANREDLARSERENLPAPLLKRLRFDEEKIAGVIEGIHSLIKLEDPVGKTLLATGLDDGLELYKVTCPIGVIGIIFESRPDALVQIATLCLKSGNAVLLKGGSEARATNRVLADVVIGAAVKAGLPPDWAALLETRAEVNDLLKLDQYVDLIIPRGSNDFVRYIMDNSRIAVLGHADGVCHMYIDSEADADMAVRLAVDSKTQYTAVCNAMETLIIHSDQVNSLLPRITEALEASQVKIFGCERTCELLGCEKVQDWHTEYLDFKLAIKIVDSLEEAIDHINTFGSGHTESIVTSD